MLEILYSAEELEKRLWSLQLCINDWVIRHYGILIMIAKWQALINSIVVALNRFLGLCVLTWASMVVLGGLVPNLDRRELMLTSAVLLISAVQLFCADSWFTSLPAPRLSEGLFYGRRWQQRIWSLWPVTSFAMVGHSCIFLSFAVSIKELVYAHTGKVQDMCIPSRTLAPMKEVMSSFITAEPKLMPKPAGFKTSLRIYYVLVLINATMAFLGIWVFLVRVVIGVGSTWLYSYGYRVLQVAIQQGQGTANNIELVDAVFEILGNECRHDVLKSMAEEKPTADSTDQQYLQDKCALKKLDFLCKEVTVYMYEHPRGFEATMQALNSTDRYVQEAAALMIGLWVDLEMHSSSRTSTQLLGQVPLLRSIMEIAMKGPMKGPRGIAVMWSLEKLAKHTQIPLVVVQEFMKNLLDHVEYLVYLLNAQYQHNDYEDLLCPYLGVLTTFLERFGSNKSFFEDEHMQLLHQNLSKVLENKSNLLPCTKYIATKFLQNPYFQQNQHIQVGNSGCGLQAFSINYNATNDTSDDDHICYGKIAWSGILKYIIASLFFYLFNLGVCVFLYYSLCGGDHLPKQNSFQDSMTYHGY